MCEAKLVLAVLIVIQLGLVVWLICVYALDLNPDAMHTFLPLLSLIVFAQLRASWSSYSKRKRARDAHVDVSNDALTNLCEQVRVYLNNASVIGITSGRRALGLAGGDTESRAVIHRLFCTKQVNHNRWCSGFQCTELDGVHIASYSAY